jgi:hypothetical protein
MRKILRKWLFRIRLKFAIIKANKLKKRTYHKYLVMMSMGKPRIYSKAVLKEFIKKGHFKKGVTIQKLEDKALYITL